MKWLKTWEHDMKMPDVEQLMKIPDVEQLITGPDNNYISIDDARKLRDAALFWKAAHDNQVKLKSILIDRPDLKDRAEKIGKLIAFNKDIKDSLNRVLDTSVDMATSYADHAHLMARKEAVELINKLP
jgi:hypothetical protein